MDELLVGRQRLTLDPRALEVDAEGNLYVNLTAAVPLVVTGTVLIGGELPAGTQVIGTVLIGGELPAGTQVIGTVLIGGELPAGTQTIGTVLIGGELPAGTQAIGTVTAVQPTHNLLNANANVQVQNADVQDDNPLPALLRSTDELGNYWNLGVDPSTMVLDTIDYEHHEIHSGSHFFVAGHATVGITATLEVVVTVPETTAWPHMLFWWSSSLSLTIEMFEGTTGVVGGASVTPRNSDRNNDAASGLTVVTNPASIAGDGTLIWSAAWGSKQAGGARGRNTEIILRSDTTYLWRVTSGANGNMVAYEALWYEHTNKA